MPQFYKHLPSTDKAIKQARKQKLSGDKLFWYLTDRIEK